MWWGKIIFRLAIAWGARRGISVGEEQAMTGRDCTVGGKRVGDWIVIVRRCA
jgi:hypothetical protein